MPKQEYQQEPLVENEDIRNLVIARLEAMPPNVNISIGSKGDFGRDDLIQHVERGTEIGEQIAKIQMEYLRSLKEGILYGEGE